MKRKKKKEVIYSSHYTNKLRNIHNIEDLALVLKDFLKKGLKIKYHYTFPQLIEIIKRKRIDVKIKEEIKEICLIFENLEYLPRKPGKRELRSLKRKIRVLINSVLPSQSENVTKIGPITAFVRRFKTRKKRHHMIKDRVENSKKRKTEVIISRVKQNINKVQEYDKECAEIEKFVIASINVGESITKVRKDLKDMGFHENRINLVLRKIK